MLKGKQSNETDSSLISKHRSGSSVSQLISSVLGTNILDFHYFLPQWVFSSFFFSLWRDMQHF